MVDGLWLRINHCPLILWWIWGYEKWNTTKGAHRGRANWTGRLLIYWRPDRMGLMQHPGALWACDICVMKVMPTLITSHIPICTQSLPYTMRLALVNVLIIKRILSRIGMSCFSGKPNGGRGKTLWVSVKSPAGGDLVLGNFLLGTIFWRWESGVRSGDPVAPSSK